MVAKNILLIGATRSGKSALANVLTETNEFTEGHVGVSQTKEVKVVEFKTHSGGTCQLIDVMGFGDTCASQEESLYSLAEIGYAVREGLNQVLLTVSNPSSMHVTSSAKASYDWLKKIIFDEEFINHVTVVRTKFEFFDVKEECKKDEQECLKEWKRDRYGEVIIHVDNPRVDSDYLASKRGRKDKDSNEEARRLSRQVVLKRLEECESNFYCPESLVILNESIGEEMKGILEGKGVAEDEAEYEYRKKKVVRKFIEYIRNRRGVKLDIGYDFWEELDKTEKKLETEIKLLEKEREAELKQFKTEKRRERKKEPEIFQQDSEQKEAFRDRIEKIVEEVKQGQDKHR